MWDCKAAWLGDKYAPFVPYTSSIQLYLLVCVAAEDDGADRTDQAERAGVGPASWSWARTNTYVGEARLQAVLGRKKNVREFSAFTFLKCWSGISLMLPLICFCNLPTYTYNL